jgi:DNA-binding response OmpR family regulator/two-component sensor histidine kinase
VKELARSTTLGEEDRRLVGVVERNSERMIRLTDQLLQFNQSAASRDELSVERTDVAGVLRKMLENFEYMFRQKNLAVHLDAPSMLDAYCDREKVERIVFNLVSNAVKYTPEHGRIEVSLKSDGQNASIDVADTGIGIAPEKMSRIFNRFERVGEKVGDVLPTGFGIGLNYAQHLAEVHKGSLSVRSNDPIGSIFTFTFPCGKEAYASEAIWEKSTEKEREETQEPLLTPADLEEVNVLVVEDNADMREYIRSYLSPHYHVMTAEDGEQAWKCIRISAPDLIVSDVMMPFKDGYTLCKEIKNDPEFCHLPVILLTAKADMENHIRGLELGADAYIGKPFDPQFLMASVSNLLENRKRMQKELSEKPASVESLKMNTHDKLFMEKLYALVEEHLGEEDFNVTTMALELGMSRTSLFSKLKALLGQSPQSFLLGYRLTRAMELLKEGELNVSEVAYKVGFSTLTGFSRSFKNKFGVPPSSV